MKKILTLILLNSFISLMALAHPGGHYTEADLPSLHEWNYNNQVLHGNYMTSNQEYVIVEGINGTMNRIRISALNKSDLEYVQSEKQRAAAFNGMLPKNNKENRFIEHWRKNSMTYSLFFLIAGLLTIVLRNEMKRKATAVWARNLASVLSVCFLMLTVISCKKHNPVPVTPSTGIPRTAISFLDSAYAPYRPAVTTFSDSNYYHVSSNGMPQHNMMIGITSWQQQVPINQPYGGSNSWSIPLQPVYATTPMSTRTNFMKGAVAIAVNGIPIFNALNNRGEDSYLIGELDQWGGHCGRADDYHYHAAPMHLSGTSGLMPIAFALDGFPVYGSKEPNGANMLALDTCHGHVGSNGIYHYHGTTNYPYVVGAMKGKVTLDPTTPAPENQILPQAFADPVRPATSPLRNAVITGFTSTGINHYLLTYKIGTKNGYVEYYWDASNRYTYSLTDTSGNTVTNTYQR